MLIVQENRWLEHGKSIATLENIFFSFSSQVCLRMFIGRLETLLIVIHYHFSHNDGAYDLIDRKAAEHNREVTMCGLK